MLLVSQILLASSGPPVPVRGLGSTEAILQWPGTHLAAYMCAIQWLTESWPLQGGWPQEDLWRAASAMFLWYSHPVELVVQLQVCAFGGGPPCCSSLCNPRAKRWLASTGWLTSGGLSEGRWCYACRVYLGSRKGVSGKTVGW